MSAQTSTFTYTGFIIYCPVINNSQLFSNKNLNVGFSQAVLTPCCPHSFPK